MTSYEKLRKLIDDILKLGNLDPKDPRFEKWANDVKQFLKSEYGENSKNYLKFNGFWGGVDAYLASPDHWVLQDAVSKNLEEAVKFLGSLLSELLSQGIPDNS